MAENNGVTPVPMATFQLIATRKPMRVDEKPDWVQRTANITLKQKHAPGDGVDLQFMFEGHIHTQHVDIGINDMKMGTGATRIFLPPNFENCDLVTAGWKKYTPDV